MQSNLNVTGFKNSSEGIAHSIFVVLKLSRNMKKILLCLLLVGSSVMGYGQLTITLQEAVTGLNDAVDIAHAGDDRLFLVRQPGLISIVESNMTIITTPFLNIQSSVNDSGNEMGLLGLAFHPDYVNNGYFYVNYTAGPNTARITRISRFSVSANPNVADPNTELVILEASQPYSNHNGGDLEFGVDGYLYIGFGDGGSANDPGNRAQNMMEPMGKMFRIDVDNGSPYSIPATNPFVNAIDTLPEIWASGLRNPWRFGFDRLTHDLWIGDVGQNAMEEVDFWPAGDNSGPNFGWRCYEANLIGVSGGCAPQSAYVAPVADHVNSFNNWCSVIGGRVYRGSAFPQLYGRYLYTDYCKGDWFSLVSDSMGGFIESQVSFALVGTISAIGENADGDMFACSEGNGKLYRICPDEPPVLSLDTNGLLASTPAVSYTWYYNNAVLPDTGMILDPMNNGGNYYVVVNIGAGCTFQSNTISVSGSGIEAMDAQRGIKLYPNPANAAMRVQLSDKYDGAEIQIQILDLSGSLLKTIDSTSTNVRIDTRDLQNGQYQLVVKKNGRIQAMKLFVVVH